MRQAGSSIFTAGPLVVAVGSSSLTRDPVHWDHGVLAPGPPGILRQAFLLQDTDGEDEDGGKSLYPWGRGRKPSWIKNISSTLLLG